MIVRPTVFIDTIIKIIILSSDPGICIIRSNNASLGMAFINNTSSVANNTGLFFNNNRVEALYLGILGVINNNINSEIRISNSRNLGTYQSPFSKAKNQFSGLMSLNYSPLFSKNTVIKLSLAIDSGELYEDRFGFYLGLRKNW